MSHLKPSLVTCIGVLLAILGGSSGCDSQQRSLSIKSPPVGLSQVVGNGTVTFYEWNFPSHFTVMICCDIPNRDESVSLFDRTVGNGFPKSLRCDGFVSQGDRKVEWMIEDTYEKASKTTFRLNKKEFKLSDGTLFLVTTKGGKPEIEQMKCGLMDVKLDSESLKAFARNNPAVRELLKFAEE